MKKLIWKNIRLINAKLPILFITAVLMGLLSLNVIAQEVPLVAEEKKTITTVISKGVQSIFDDSVPVFVEVMTNFDADRLEIEAVFSSKNLSLKESSTRFFTKIVAGEKKVFEYKFTPNFEADSNVLFKSQAWQNDVNFIDIKTLQLKFDSSLQIVPQSDEYKQNLRNWNTIKLFLLILALTIFVILGYMFYNSFRIWISRD